MIKNFNIKVGQLWKGVFHNDGRVVFITKVNYKDKRLNFYIIQNFCTVPNRELHFSAFLERYQFIQGA